MLYTKTAAARILNLQGLSVKVISLTAVGSVFSVVYTIKGRGKCCTFISRRQFKAEFARFRMQSSESVVLRQDLDSTDYIALGREEYRVSPHEINGYVCECPDFFQQVEAGLPRQCCKHIYAVLSLAFRSDSTLPCRTTSRVAPPPNHSLGSVSPCDYDSPHRRYNGRFAILPHP